MIEFGPELTNYGMMTFSADDTPGAPGGTAKRFLASGTLLIGDAVLVSAADTVLKTVTTTNHKNRLGIVVGGTTTFMSALIGSDVVGTQAALTGEQVWVQIDGIAWGVADAAIAAIMTKLRLGTTTAGRLLGGADTTDVAAGQTGLILGQNLDIAAAAAAKIRVLIDRG